MPVPLRLPDRTGLSILSAAMGWRRIKQGIELLTLEIQPTSCPVCRKVLYRNITFFTGGWARCTVCNEMVHYACLSGGRFLKDRPRVCIDCREGRVRPAQKMPMPPPQPQEVVPPAPPS